MADQPAERPVDQLARKCSNMSGVTRQLVDLEGYKIINKNRYERVVWERRFMFGAIALSILAILFFIISIATAHWAIIDIPYSINHTIRFHLGIWGEYRTDFNQSNPPSIWIRHFPDPPPTLMRLVSHDLPHFYRTQAIFSVIAFALMLTAIGFAVYSFKHHRYMYKRLVAGLMAFSAMCVFVVIEVLVHSINEWQLMSSESKVKREDYILGTQYGYSIVLAWIVFAIFVASTVVFIFGGRKQKGTRAATQEFEVEDRPINLGR